LSLGIRLGKREYQGAKGTAMTRGCIFTLVVVLTGLVCRSGSAATNNPVITLSCDGKVTMAGIDKPDPINKMGVVVNTHSVAFNGYNVGITSVNADIISFNETTASGIEVSIWGTVDRVTGALQATQVSPGFTASYDLICKPAARMF
jgi:hypothetical protein